jgi:hypothetical protein
MSSIAEADYGATAMAMGGSEQPGDEGLAVRFLYLPYHNEQKSKEEGRPIFEDREYVEIRVPGRRDFQTKLANEINKARFPVHYAKFKARESQEAEAGTPLTEYPGVTRGQVEELQFFHVVSVEQLAAVPDSSLSSMHGGLLLKQKAAQYLDASKDNAAAAKLEEANNLIANLNDRLEALENAEPVAKPKRKRRTAAEMEASKE